LLNQTSIHGGSLQIFTISLRNLCHVRRDLSGRTVGMSLTQAMTTCRRIMGRQLLGWRPIRFFGPIARQEVANASKRSDRLDSRFPATVKIIFIIHCFAWAAK
jgi:hypothetical protein